MTRIVLDWPPKGVWRNDQYGSDNANRAARRRYKADAYILTLENKPPKFTGPIKVTVTYHQKRKGRAADEDNVLGSLKWAFDGIAQALGVDDNCFQMTRPIKGERTQYGCIIIDLEAA